VGEEAGICPGCGAADRGKRARLRRAVIVVIVVGTIDVVGFA
jgi:hypothetical protein